MEKLTKENYQGFLNDLQNERDISFKKFQEGLFKEDVSMLGIRTPTLKKIAKSLASDREVYLSFIKYNTHMYYEEKVLHGLLLSYLKIPFSELLDLIREFLPYNDNWAINDLTCTNLKAFRKNREEGFSFIQECLSSNQPWTIRFGLVLLLDHYIESSYIEEILRICDTVKEEEYYVKMAVAWLLSICFIKFRDLTLTYLQNNHLDTWTYHKTISKICDSYRVSAEDKELLKSMKRKA